MTSKKDYVAVAKILKRVGAERNGDPHVDAGTITAVVDIAHALADYFKGDNPSFDKERFLAACGFSQGVK